MKKTPLAILSVIVIGVSMVFAFAGVRQGELPQDIKAPVRVASPALEAVSVQVVANDLPLATLIAPMDTQAEILIDEVPLMLSMDSPAPEVLPAEQPVVNQSLSEIFIAAGAAPGDQIQAQADPDRPVQEALADMMRALDRLSQQAEVARESVALLVSQYEAPR